MTPTRLRILGGLVALVVVIGGILVITRDDGDGDQTAELHTDDSTTSTHRSTTTSEDGSSSTSSTEKDGTASSSTSTSTSSSGGSGTTGSPTTGASPTTAAPAPPTTARPVDPFSSARIKLTQVASVGYPIAMAVRPGDGSLWIARKSGEVCRLSGGSCTASQLVATVSTGGEQGLLGIAFNPAGSRLYISYTDGAGDSRVEWRPMNGNTLGAPSPVFFQDQPEANHNGGNIVFGPDGYLYLGLGDGGGGGDHHGTGNGNGQDPATHLGKILRINPSNNAAANWIMGVRNPWRFSFDRSSGSLWVADVGQDKWEEVTYLPAGAQQGRNLGWRCYEGTHVYAGCTPSGGHTAPIHEYAHGPGCSVTGGYVYRGSKIPALVGAYLFSDYCDGQIRGFTIGAGRVRTLRVLAGAPGNVVSFGQDGNGELYVLAVNPSAIWRIAPA